MPKTATAKKAPKPAKIDSTVLHDIIDKVNDNQKQVEKKLEELSMMCSGKQCKAK